MQTVAAMSLSELFHRYLFQLAVTFHGGDNMIGFAWGDTRRPVASDVFAYMCHMKAAAAERHMAR